MCVCGDLCMRVGSMWGTTGRGVGCSDCEGRVGMGGRAGRGCVGNAYRRSEQTGTC